MFEPEPDPDLDFLIWLGLVLGTVVSLFLIGILWKI